MYKARGGEGFSSESEGRASFKFIERWVGPVFSFDSEGRVSFQFRERREG